MNDVNKPALRFEGFEEDWEKFMLSELFIKSGSGGTPKSNNKEYYNGHIPFLSISDISNSNGYINTTEKTITEKGLNNSAAWVVPSGSISLAMYASVGKLAILNIDAATSQAFYNMVFDDNNLRNYVYHRLSKSEIFGEWNKLISTGTQSNLNANKVKSFELFIPISKKEIENISLLFTKLDKIITLKQEEVRLLKEQKSGLLQKMFPKDGEDEPELRFEDFTGTWEQLELGEITNKIGSGKTPRGGNEVYLSDGVPLLRSQNIYSDKVNLEDIVFISEEINNTMKNSTVKKNDILLNITGASIGRSAVYSYSEEANVNQHVCIIRPKNNISSNFIQLNLTSRKGQNQIDMNQAGGGREGLNFQQISKFKFKYPEIKEQTKIGNFFKQLDDTITLQEQQLEKLKEMKKGYLQQMFI